MNDLKHIIAAVCALVALIMSLGCRSDEDGASREASDLAGAVDTVEATERAVVGELVYVPAYSHVFHQDGSREMNLTTTLSIRNTDPDHPITITGVRYFNSGGSLIRNYLEQPLQLAPLASRAFVVEERDKAGGVGANFTVQWQAGVQVARPIIEAVMITTASTQGISFVSRGQAVRSLGEEEPSAGSE